ncbi:hypothetical protein HYDPIDRAFT_113608 [Hydnomerulius pinastri MD-312]|uniref:DUF647-domain-containing protein n=1 Tax=Hydnomerulius pinastri MD-312 TaxID=994086 RepID=A0A0C9W7C2_9AGAM|nr:hypothetical protein HYDPIDRAFT_113608 [Hydnomerulius pinastri MD-312]
MTEALVLVERDDTGRVSRIPIAPGVGRSSTGGIKALPSSRSPRSSYAALTGLGSIRHIFYDLFLPAGYPASVSPDYLQYQTYNALQAFCSSVSGLLASRGALEGVGVGNASASATQALLLTVLKDVFSRVTTIIAAYYCGTSLYPETKTFRFLADVVNDASIVLDTLIPYIGAINLSETIPFVPTGATLQIVALCMSGALRSLCGLVAGGSKAALTNHFASPLTGKGDVGELNAKDASRETVIGLSGMLLGTLLIPYINTRASTYIMLFVLVGGHLLFNYLAVRSVVLRTLNRQRTSILWTDYRKSPEVSKRRALSPSEVASRELIFETPMYMRDCNTGQIIGRCTLGAPLQTLMPLCTTEHIAAALQVFQKEKYVLFLADRKRWQSRGPTIFVCFKDGYRPIDQLRAWVHSMEVAAVLNDPHAAKDPATTYQVVHQAMALMREAMDGFVTCLVQAGWDTADDSMMFGSPTSLILGTDKDLQDAEINDQEVKKDR